MGEVKETVKGDGPKKKIFGKTVEHGNLIEQVANLKDKVSKCASVKDNDAATEGDSSKSDNLRKAALLKAAHSLLTTVQVLLEEY